MKKKLTKILGVGIALVMVLSLSFALAPSVMADEEEWDDFGLPDEGALGDWFMGDDIAGLGPFAQAIDGTFYLYVDFTAGTDDLYTSDDDGRSWEASGFDTDFAGVGPLVDIACSSEDADVLYVANATNVYRSDDAGDVDSWTDLGAVSDGAFTATAITCLAVGYADDDAHIFVGDASGPGEVMYYRDAPFASVWTDLDVSAPDSGGAIDDCDVYGIQVSPNFEDDVLVVALVYDWVQGESFVTANEGAGIGLTNWNDCELEDDTGGSFAITGGTDPVFVEDFDIDDDYELFVGVIGPAHAISGDGGVYRITGWSDSDDFLLSDVDDDIATLDLVGDIGGTSLMAGTAAAGQASIWYSTDDGDGWDETDKAPTGVGATANWVIVDDDFADSGVAWCVSDAATKEGGVHHSSDFGATWNGISMLDTDMSGGIHDFAFAPGYGEDSAPMFLITQSSIAAADDSVWKYDGDDWCRVWLDTTNALDLVGVSPYYADDMAVFIADSAAPEILYTHDGGAEFDAMVRDPVGAITAWVVLDDETVITGDAAGDYYKTTRYGRRTWDTDTISAGNWITDFALSPAFASDGTILCGDDASQVFISTDEGDEWDEVSGSDLAGLTAVDTDTYVCFHVDYASNNTFYAASDDAIGRCEVDSAEDWDDQDIDSMNINDFVASFSAASGIVCSDDGTLYAADATPVVVGAITAVPGVAADALAITETNAAGSGGVFVVGGGSVNVTLSGTATFNAVTGAWTTATVGDTIRVEAANAGTFGTWSLTTTTCFATIVSDDDGDASVWAGGAIGAGAFALPDAGTAAIAAGDAVGGVARCLNPTDGSSDIEWELNTAGFAGGEALGGIGTAATASSLELTYGSNVLWAIDTAAAPQVIWEYTDTLAAPVILKSPGNGTTSIDKDEVVLEWEDLNADTVNEYSLKLSKYEDFTDATTYTSIDDTSWSSVEADVTLSAGTTYYWKVQVSDPVESRWSAEWSFQTKVAQVTAPVEVRPLPGAQDVILMPTFAWRPADGVDYYELDVATDANFTEIVTSGTPKSNTWAIDVSLDYGTVYYWRVRGIAPTGIPEADYVVSIFTTMAKPEKAPPPVEVEEVQPPEITVEVPAPVQAIPTWMALTIIIIGAILVIALVVLIVRTRRVV